MFPLNQSFDNRDWFFEWQKYWRDKGKGFFDLEEGFHDIIKKIEMYQMPLIRLDQDNSRAAICLIFEKVNVGGKQLDVFDLLTAIFAASDFDLRSDWYGPDDSSATGRRDRIVGYPSPRDVLTKIKGDDFLQACTLLHTRKRKLECAAKGVEKKNLPGISCNRDALLALPLANYRRHADAVEDGMKNAATFLNEHKIIWHKDVPYNTLTVGLASTFAILGQDAHTPSASEKIERWFWSVALGELYGSSTETRLARDVPELVSWIQDQGPKPRTLDEAVFNQERFYSLRARTSAAYKSIHALLMRNCRDFVTGQPVEIISFFDHQIDIHHIFPRNWCEKRNILPRNFNSIINKTPLSKTTNRSIGGESPSAYLKKIEDKGVDGSILDDILRSHLIEPEHLRNDDFDSFFATRMRALSKLVEGAMGKKVVTENEADE